MLVPFSIIPVTSVKGSGKLIKVDNSDIVAFKESVLSSYRAAKTAPLNFDKFMYKSYRTLASKANRVYPYTVKIPKSIDQLLRGDFSPAYEIVIEEPPTLEDGTPIWFGDSSKGLNLRFGYKNGDSRFISDEKLSGEKSHFLLGGATGMGKSSTTNSVAFGLAFEYAPWELKLTLNDAKVVEFKRYALGSLLPHVSAIAATTDVDYLISVLADLEQTMKRWNSVFAKAGVQNLWDFRETTGLTVPRNLILTDEFQTLFKNAGKKLSKVVDIYDSFSRLGRNTGFQLYLASQEIGSDLPSNTLNQIKMRACLGASQNVSEIILGNDQARTVNQIGKLLVNANNSAGDKKDNVEYRVPYQSSSLFEKQKTELEKLGNKYSFAYPLTFYDEDSKVYESDFLNYVESFNNNKNKIYLGEPSFVVNDSEKAVKIEMTGEDVENILVLTNNSAHLERYCKILKYNFMTLKDRTRHVIFISDKMYESKCNISELSDGKLIDLRSADSLDLQSIFFSVYNRLIMVEADNETFRKLMFNGESDAIFYTMFQKGSKYDTELNRSRTFYMLGLIQSPDFKINIGLANLSDDEFKERRNNKIDTIIRAYDSYGCFYSKLTHDRLPDTYIWIMGMNKVLGYGRDTKDSYVEKFKKVLLDSSIARIRFIIFSTTMDQLSALRNGIRYYIFDETPEQELRRCNYDDYPQGKAAVLGVLYDMLAADEKTKKFKKMFFDDEI